MNHKLRTNKAFTLIELVVSVAILAMVLSFASVIFNVGIESHRIAGANAEIMRKLRAITDQLNADFKGLRKDAEIFVVWVPAIYDPFAPVPIYGRFDRIMFFADGDFNSYGYGTNPLVRGNTARICYMLAKRPAENPLDPPIKAHMQEPQERILARTQHILTADTELVDIHPTMFVNPDQWDDWNNRDEFDKISLEQWKNIPWLNLPPWGAKADMLSVITDVKTDLSVVDGHIIGAVIDTANPDSIHKLLCEGVGEFSVQGWYDNPDDPLRSRWVPEIDPGHDGDLSDTDFLTLPGGELDVVNSPGVLYPINWRHDPNYGGVGLGGVFGEGQLYEYPRARVDEEHFNEIPGLGRALKFTFTLYDSRGIVRGGREFTHIVYLDK